MCLRRGLRYYVAKNGYALDDKVSRTGLSSIQFTEEHSRLCFMQYTVYFSRFCFIRYICAVCIAYDYRV